MKISKKLSGFSAILLMATSMGSVYAEEGDAAQTRIHERDRVEQSLQTSGSDSAQIQNSEEQRLMHKNQYQHQNRYMQENSITGSMNRQSNATRSMGGGRR